MRYEISLNGRTYEVEVEVASPMTVAQFRTYAPAAPAPVAAPVTAPAAVAETAAAVPVGAGEPVRSPMPGNILKVNVTQGQTVKEGDVLVVLEAMKMENEIMAPRAGTVTQVAVTRGATVDTDGLLVVIG